jgi:hypothetical protein
MKTSTTNRTTGRKTKLVTTYGIIRSLSGNFIVSAMTRWTYKYLRDKNGYIRRFSTRNSARKRISRERLGNYHN